MLAACEDCPGCKALILLPLPWVTGSPAWGGLRGSLGWTVGWTPWNQNNTEWQNLQDSRGVGETVPLGALLLGMFWMTGFLQVFSVSHPCFWSGPLPVTCRCQKVSVAMLFVLCSNWPKLLLSLCNTTATPETQWCRFLTVWPFSYGQGGEKDLESLQCDQSFQPSMRTLVLVSGKAINSPVMWLGFLHYTLL